jgi:SAM-dependent methyltransferase
MDAIDAEIEEAIRAPIEGWDFSWLEDRARETPPPWSFRELVRSAAAGAAHMLDIDTGGGEFLERAAPLSARVVATEGYGPNVWVAADRLRPVGVQVVHAESAPDNIDQAGTSPEAARSVLPFRSGAFDLIVDRHSSYWPSEVHRVLVPGGRFLTQQGGEAGTSGGSWAELFDRPAHRHERFTLDFAMRQLQDAGFEILRAEEANTPMTFRDLAGVVYYLRLVPWAVEGFDPEADRRSLVQVEETIERDEALVVRGVHMVIDARRG